MCRLCNMPSYLLGWMRSARPYDPIFVVWPNGRAERIHPFSDIKIRAGQGLGVSQNHEICFFPPSENSVDWPRFVVLRWRDFWSPVEKL